MIIDETSPTSSNPYVRTILSSNSSSWPSPRKSMAAVIDFNKTRMYVWGGTQSIGPDNQKTDGTMYILEIKNYSWVANALPTQPIGRQYHTATLVPDGRIIMIGGIFNPNMSQLDIYDTISNQWSQKVTLNGSVSGRWSHTATLATDGKSIIIFGGVSNNTNTISGISILNLTNYVWTTVFPSGNPPVQYPNSHTAVLYKDYIFFAFGIIGSNFISTVSILDISNNQYRWVDSYNPRGQTCIIESVCLMATCYNIWIWTTVKWNLANQECGNDVRVFWLTIPLNPTGWVRDFILVINFESENESEKDKCIIFAFKCIIIISFLPTIIMTIVSSEILLQKNPAPGISGSWGFKEIAIVIM
ncbi:5662_t:CDS:2, partial [Gigaspora margarita]